ADFEHRFGRRPEGMWLAETAADLETLDILAEAGLRFTILSPHQAHRVRPKSEVRGQRSEIRDQRSEVRDQRSEVGDLGQPGSSLTSDLCPLTSDEAWEDVSGGRIDTRRAYLQRLPSGRSIALFFYDGEIARAIAFERLLARGEALVDRLRAGFADNHPGPQLVHVATDGESYGHHHGHGDMAMAYALD